jgi:hypothetical protein
MRTTEDWYMSIPPEVAQERIAGALRGLGMHVEERAGGLDARAPRSLRRNRHAAEVSIELAPDACGGTTATATVEMAGGTKHLEVLEEIVQATGRDIFIGRSTTQPRPRA